MFSIGNPRFTHDCSVCLFLGRLDQGDAYYCPGNASLGGSVIVRRGSEAPDYASGPVQVVLGVDRHPLGDLARYVLREGLVRVSVVPESVARRRELDAPCTAPCEDGLATPCLPTCRWL